MNPLAHTLSAWFGCDALGGHIAALLYERGGEPMSRADLLSALGKSRFGVRKAMRQLRRLMDPGSIAWSAPDHWLMTPVGLADCERGIAEAERLAA